MFQLLGRTDIREKERFLLELSAYVQSVNIALTPVIPTTAVIVTFLIHTGLGYDLLPAEVCCFMDQPIGEFQTSS